MINLEDRKRRARDILNRTHREDILDLIAEVERLQQKADTLYKAANAVVDQITEEMGFGAEFNKDGLIELSLQKAEVEELISVILNWNREE